MSIEPMSIGGAEGIAKLGAAFAKMAHDIGIFGALMGWSRPRKGRCGRVRRNLPRNYRARSKR